MLKAVILMKRRPGMTHDDFMIRLRVSQMPLIRQLPGLSRVVVSDAVAGPGGHPLYDAMAEFWFDDLEAVRSLVTSDEAQVAETALGDFIDLDHYETFLSIEHEVEIEPATTGGASGSTGRGRGPG